MPLISRASTSRARSPRCWIIEGGFDLDGDLGVLRDLYRLGLRSSPAFRAQLGEQFRRFLLFAAQSITA